MSDLWDNPMGTDGFEFVEYTAPDPKQLDTLFKSLGFIVAARHRSKDVTLYRQGNVNFIVNAEPTVFDSVADVVLHEQIADVLPFIVRMDEAPV